MKRAISFLLFVGASIAVISITLIKRDTFNAQKSHRHILYLDPLFSTTTQEQITHFVNKEIHNNLKDSGFIELLVQRFPFIHNVEMHRSPNGLLAIDIHAASPVLSVNEHCVLTHQGLVVAKDIFKSNCVQDLYSVCVAAAVPFPIVSQELKATIEGLSAQLFEEFNITLVNETECWLHDKQSNQFAILFNSFSIPDASLIQKCSAIKDSVQARATAHRLHKKKNNNAVCIADVRFKNQIIVRDSMEGLHHG